jgi:ABC-type amino acid transport system permease subunit
MGKIALKNKYHERLVRWRDKSITQLSYFNNLTLTLAVGFLSFSYDKINFSNYYFVFNNSDLLISIKNINCKPTLLSLSLILIFLSIIFGLLVALVRLYDFRITSQIIQVRSWVGENLNIQYHKYSVCKRILLIYKVSFVKYPKFEYRECVKFKFMSNIEKRAFKKNFRELRSISHNLGELTWSNLSWQIVFFFFGILLFVIAQFSN